MNKVELRQHCQRQIDLCTRLNDNKHLEEHKLTLSLLNENEQLQRENQKYKEVIDKAIQFVEFQRKNPQYDNIWCGWECNELIDILKEVE